MQGVRVRRRRFIDLRRITIGDYVVLVASLMSVVSLFMPWFISSIPRSHGEWAFTYSELASVLVIVVFLLTIFLVVYPAIASDLGLPPLPFAPPLILLVLGTVLLLSFTYELGKYACIQCEGVSSRGFGVWVGLISALAYIVGSVIKWGTRPVRRSESGARV